jgi:hypothetical protein
MTPPPRPPGGAATGWKVFLITVLLGGIMMAVLASFSDPHLNFPVISQVVCSVKGDTWYGGGILGEPGCYTPSP